MVFKTGWLSPLALRAMRLLVMSSSVLGGKRLISLANLPLMRARSLE